VPGAFHSFQLLGPEVVQRDVEADDQIAHRPRRKNLPGSSRGHHTRRDVHRDSTDIAVAQFDLAGVEPCPDLQADAVRLRSRSGCVCSPSPRAEGGSRSTIGWQARSARSGGCGVPSGTGAAIAVDLRVGQVLRAVGADAPDPFARDGGDVLRPGRPRRGG
jgi:hypothetical protein